MQAAAATKRTDLDQLQGSWESVAGPRPARLLVAGNRYAFEFLDGHLVYMGTFTLADGGLMDMHVAEGPAEHKGQVAPCIYRLEEGKLRWCPGRIGTSRHLSEFPSTENDHYICLVFQKASRIM